MLGFRRFARYSATVLLCTACLGGSVARAQQTDPPVPDEPTPEAIVSRVIDGSTLDAEINGRRVAVGYLGVETMAANQPCGQAALQRNRELAGDHVLLMSDPQYEFDPLGRRLYYAFTPDGVSIDETLVREGLARAVRTDGIEGTTLEAAEAEASAAGRGCIWGESPPTG